MGGVALLFRPLFLRSPYFAVCSRGVAPFWESFGLIVVIVIATLLYTVTVGRKRARGVDLSNWLMISNWETN